MGNKFLIMTETKKEKNRGKKDISYYKQQETLNHAESVIQRCS